MISDRIIKALQIYTKKANVAITSRGNDAIFKAFEILKREGCKNILFPDQAGWWKCPDIAKKVGLEFAFFETKDGLLDIDLLGKFVGNYDSLYICSLGGYYVEQPLFEIYQVCRDNDCLLLEKLENASIRFNFLVSLNFEIKKELNNFKVYFPESRSLNVVVEKNERVLEYCNRKGCEYKLCPFYNRINKDAISIEVKRLNFGGLDGK